MSTPRVQVATTGGRLGVSDAHIAPVPVAEYTVPQWGVTHSHIAPPTRLEQLLDPRLSSDNDVACG